MIRPKCSPRPSSKLKLMPKSNCLIFDYQNIYCSFQFPVRVEDKGTPVRDARSEVIVRVSRNRPVFNIKNYETSIKENHQVGKSVIRVQATDTDNVSIRIFISFPLNLKLHVWRILNFDMFLKLSTVSNILSFCFVFSWQFGMIFNVLENAL